MPATKKSSAKRVAPKTVADYIAAVPEQSRPQFDKLYATVRSGMPPDATEVISYGIVAFRRKRVLVWIAGFSNHCSLFPTASLIDDFSRELEGYTISKGTVQFQLDKPLPTALIKKMIKRRVEQDSQRA
jgi:uncharacterized protein YdhG (YjbR/CyaY superfamily)